MGRIWRIIKWTFGILLALIVLLAVTTVIYVRQPQFGQAPSGERLAAVQRSPHFKDGHFENEHFTPELAEGYSMGGVMYAQFMDPAPHRTPIDTIPSIKTDLHAIPLDRNVLVWFGHSSYYMQIDGMRYLSDPVFSGNASPIPGTVPSFNGTDIYTTADFPRIDVLFISHDHYDHVDHPTLLALRDRIDTVICGLGVGAHLEHWGFAPDRIIETDWHERVDLGNGSVVHTAPARHFAGRAFDRNNTLWQSYVLQTPTLKIYLGGDSGYDTHFAEIGKAHGPIDLAILDNGQYDLAWRYIHTLPDEVLKAAADLRAIRLFPVHSSKFVLANHPWDEPLTRITELNKAHGIPLVTPMIGELVDLDDPGQRFTQWWVGLE